MQTTVDQEVTIEDIDEAIRFLNAELKVDEYGKRMTWQRRKFLSDSIDDLLDLRLQLSLK